MRRITANLVMALVLLTGVNASFRASETATLIFHNGNVLTMETDLPVAQALAIGGDRVLAVGDDQTVLALADEATQIIDLEGKTLMPGFVDAHTHLFNDAAHWGATPQSVQEIGLSNGITTLANLYSVPEFIAEMQALEAQGALRIRTSLYLSYTTNCGEVLGGWYQQYPRQTDPQRMLRILGVKIFADGGSCGRPAISFEYADQGGHGDLFLSQDELNQAVEAAHARGYQVAIHAQGDLAIDQALIALGRAMDGKPNVLRHRIEHNAFVRPDQRPRYSELGIVPTLFGAYATCSGIRDGRYAEVFGQEPLTWLEDWRSLLDANPGLHAAWHGDDPWVTPLSPLLELYGFVTRNEVAEDGSVCQAPDWLKTHAITTQEALYLMTMGAAYALFMEDAVGSLKPGKFADVIVLSQSPLDTAPEQIKDIELLATLVGGRVEHCQPAWQSLCPALKEDISNVALNKPTLASRALPDRPASLAVDGQFDNWWGAGDFAPQWIEIDLEASCAIASVRLLASQDPAGNTLHRVWGHQPGKSERLLHEFRQTTTDLSWLEYTPTTAVDGIRWLRVETLESPSWIAWREIEVRSGGCGPG